MRAMKRISKAAKAGQKVRLEYLDETQSLVSGVGGNNDNSDEEDDDQIDEEYADEMSKNWEKISTMKRYFYHLLVTTIMGVIK